jgi:hypothetical protein
MIWKRNVFSVQITMEDPKRGKDPDRAVPILVLRRFTSSAPVCCGRSVCRYWTADDILSFTRYLAQKKDDNDAVDHAQAIHGKAYKAGHNKHLTKKS